MPSRPFDPHSHSSQSPSRVSLKTYINQPSNQPHHSSLSSQFQQNLRAIILLLMSFILFILAAWNYFQGYSSAINSTNIGNDNIMFADNISLFPIKYAPIPQQVKSNPIKQLVAFQYSKVLKNKEKEENNKNEEKEKAQPQNYSEQQQLQMGEFSQFSLVSSLKQGSNRLHTKINEVSLSIAKHPKLTSYSQNCYLNNLSKIDWFLNHFIEYEGYCGDNKDFYKDVESVLYGEKSQKVWRSSGKQFTTLFTHNIQIGIIQLWVPEAIKAQQIYFFGIKATETLLVTQQTLQTQYIGKIFIQKPGLVIFICNQPQCYWHYSMLMLIMEPTFQLSGIRVYQLIEEK